MPSFSDLCGYVPNPAATALIVSALTTPELPRRMLYHEDRNICLLDAVLKCKPSWQRGKQTIGDCVSWGAEGACTTIEACQAVSGQSGWEEEVATEAIYGLRVESDNGDSWDDGWFGAGAAKAVKDYGVVLRKDYSQDTGKKLRRYQRSGVPAYWIVDLNRRQIEVREMGEPGLQGSIPYAESAEVPLVLDGIDCGRIAVGDLVV